MKKLLVLAFLASLACADFQLQGVDISIELKEDGSALVEERITMLIPAADQYSIQLYESGFNTNTLANWQELTGIGEIKLHISSARSDIRNLIVRPQPLSYAGSDYRRGQLIMNYAAHPIYSPGGLVNGTGIVAVSNYKPRSARYTLNGNAFSLPRTETGDIRLDRITSLSITPPPNAEITYINPITAGLANAKFPAQSQTLSWTGLTLIQFSLEYEVEQSLDKEVSTFFSQFQDNLRTFLISTEGLALLIMAGILIISYMYLRISRR